MMTIHLRLSRSSKSFPEPADIAAGRRPLGGDDGGVPRLDAVDEEAVREAALVTLGNLLDADGAEFGVAFVDIPVFAHS